MCPVLGNKFSLIFFEHGHLTYYDSYMHAHL